ncbi:two-component system sensor histidine kinase CreC [Luteimonas fraxinea]|uniref:histidine kinase n=1 Tax=Luteimonas fraxinea TaxID=2901869 RepID=A0ABS8UGZ5_9GAMM|nr:two-component system sensor histidine kinase CreC [Luteimonas fraxinea]MCD9098783.1 two-component system sensor histidine kinase CreC [Luteimonas fraxinea]MCD9127470.1 two-component system sensor histidine kinase CreC [Luteimonas fraxinea]UHH10436.1 two-component system sensor histidine kinase CreC [Luteimonas fraxinea]
MRIGLRILLGYFLIVALAAFLLMRVFTQEIKPGVRQAMEDTLADTANVLAELATDDFLAGRIDDGRFATRVRALRERDIGGNIWGFRKTQAEYRVYVTNADGIVVFDSAGRDLGRDYSRWNDVLLTLRGQYGARSTRTNPADDSTSVMHVAAPIRDGNRVVGVLTVAKPNSAIAPFIARSERTILRWGFLLLGTALAVGLLAAWWLSRQLGGLRRYADKVTAGERATLPDSAGEFADLGRALETMRERLEGKQYVERYVHALTHELKAPLAAVRGASELLESPLPDADRARFATSVREQSERMAQMIDKLLALAAVEHRQRIEQPTDIDVRTLIDAAVAPFADGGVQVRMDIGDALELRIRGDAFLLRQLLSNLVDNACDFSPADGVVDVTARSDGALLKIVVADRGPGVPEYALPRVFERFFSLPRPGGRSRSSGLGLAFAAEVATLHGGIVRLEHREGGGTRAIVELPLPATG